LPTFDIVAEGKSKPEWYKVDDVYHLIRHLCPNCGFVMDSEFELGSPIVIDEPYPPHETLAELCPRCELDLLETPAIPITVERYSDIRKLIEQGERDRMDVKAKLPNPMGKLAKSIASFASTNGGRILLGVDRDYDITGLEEPYTDSPKGRERLLKDIRSHILPHIKPRVRPDVDFITDEESGRMVAVITICKGSRPPYYYQNVPYVRDCEESRPATPDEVDEMVQRRGKLTPTSPR